MPTVVIPKTIKVEPNTKYIGPQPGPQERFLKTSASVSLYGGAAGGGKSFALLLDAVRYAAIQPVSGFGATIFRRTSPQITQQGGLWDESCNLYPLLGGVSNKTRLEWSFPPFGCKVRFAHLQYDSDKFKLQGSQIAYIGIDEATHFTEETVFYLFSRNRSTCGITPRVRMTCNPDATSWLARFLAPWVHPNYPHPAKSGEIRHFRRDGGAIEWLPPGEKSEDSKSFTFIMASIFDNPALLATNPEYLNNLRSLPLVERQRLLMGDWHIVASGNKFKRHWFEIIPRDAVPAHFEQVVRAWDKAATEPKLGKDPDWTVGIKIGKKDGIFYVLDVVRDRLSPGKVDELMYRTAQVDGYDVEIYEEQEPGSSGVGQVARDRTMLMGYTFHASKATGNKEIRANPVSSQAEGGNIKIVNEYWTEAYLNELCAFPMVGVHDDQVDATSLGMESLMRSNECGILILPMTDEELSTSMFW